MFPKIKFRGRVKQKTVPQTAPRGNNAADFFLGRRSPTSVCRWIKEETSGPVLSWFTLTSIINSPEPGLPDGPQVPREKKLYSPGRAQIRRHLYPLHLLASFSFLSCLLLIPVTSPVRDETLAFQFLWNSLKFDLNWNIFLQVFVHFWAPKWIEEKKRNWLRQLMEAGVELWQSAICYAHALTDVAAATKMESSGAETSQRGENRVTDEEINDKFPSVCSSIYLWWPPATRIMSNRISLTRILFHSRSPSDFQSTVARLIEIEFDWYAHRSIALGLNYQKSFGFISIQLIVFKLIAFKVVRLTFKPAIFNRL